MRIGEGLVVLVTGNSTDFGEPTIRRLHGMGASLAVLSRDTKWLMYSTPHLKSEYFVFNVMLQMKKRSRMQ